MRRVAVVLLVVLGALLAPLGVGGSWARANIADEDRWARTVQDALDAPAVRSLVADEVTALVVDSVDLQQLSEELLPGPVEAVGGLLPGIQVRAAEYVRSAVTQALDSDLLDPVWSVAAREAQRQLLAILRGERGPVVAGDRGVVLDTDAVVAGVWGRIARGPLAFLSGVQPPTGASDVVLVRSEGLAAARQVWWTARWGGWLLAGAALAWLAALALARRRLWVLAAAAGSLVLGCGALALAVQQGQIRVVAAVPSRSAEPAALAVWDTAARPFLDLLAWVSLGAGAVGVLALAAAALARHTPAAQELA